MCVLEELIKRARSASLQGELVLRSRQLLQSGIDTFITGEGPHWSFPMAEELGINLIYAGHYATETFGVRVLAAHLAQKFGAEMPVF